MIVIFVAQTKNAMLINLILEKSSLVRPQNLSRISGKKNFKFYGK
jgi:hypothetical protein